MDSEDQKKQNANQLNIELNEEVAQGIYSNLAIITHSTSEFVIDFVRVMPGIPKAGVKSRIILTPEHAKRLMLALQDNVKKFEQQNGAIKMNMGNDPHLPPINFGGGNIPLA
ncbi:MAG TPA: DUF3467 domain-containing protein [Prolixibacteraceae bacterium]|nr:DUF3467 domain-containing protein [Prolixibacteraceae bacterium]HQN93493.1 DUF3467 domain-containing protein [Prolixibacteraceae bacterium]HUM88086.1 DUF3467 domain-containing protein [Prolixibacteraceae bacterium]